MLLSIVVVATDVNTVTPAKFKTPYLLGESGPKELTNIVPAFVFLRKTSKRRNMKQIYDCKGVVLGKQNHSK